MFESFSGRRAVVCVGEVLWDAVPEGLHLGGAPFNVSYHLARLGAPVRLVSRVGDDPLGREACRRVAAAHVDVSLVQTDRTLPTGFVGVTLDSKGVPAYDIAGPAAWDAIDLDLGLAAVAESSAAVVFGSLAQRDGRSRRAIRALVASAPLAVFDVNLRAPFVDSQIVADSLQDSDVVKLSDEELGQLTGWFDLPETPRAATERLAEAFGCRAVCVTRGARGAVLWHDGRWSEHPGYAVTVRDTVGAGDAFLAGLLAAWYDGQDDASALDRASRLGALVAASAGATPAYDPGHLPTASGPEAGQ